MDLTEGFPVLVRQPEGRRHVRPSGAPARRDNRRRRRAGVKFRTRAAIALLVVGVVAAAAFALDVGTSASPFPEAETKAPPATSSVLAGSADKVAAEAASTMFVSAPVAVIANASSAADL